MKTLYLITNKGIEVCRDLQAMDTERISYEKRKIQEDARKYEDHIRNTRIRLGLEVSK